MRLLQDLFESMIEEQFSDHKLGALFIKKKIREKGFEITDQQLAEIETALRDGDLGGLTLSLEGDQVGTGDTILEEPTQQCHTLDLSDSGQDIEKFIEQVDQSICELMPRLVDEAAEPILRELKRDAPEMLRAREQERKEFEARLATAWHGPLGLLEMLVVICLEAGAGFNDEFRSQASEENDYVFEVLTHLHARACQIASEILVLLKSGHADGAHARWRALHELAVVSFFVKSAGKDVAERYLAYEGIQSYKAAKEYQRYYQRLGYDPIPEKELAELQSIYDDLVRRFGSSYKRGFYGWAAPAIEGNDCPKFRDIEREVSLDHLRPFYKMACYNVHADPKGAFFRLGLYPTNQEMLLAGPSNTGLADPGQGTALSLFQVTAALLLTKPNIDRLVMCNILTKLTREIGQEFAAVQESLGNGSEAPEPYQHKQ